MYENIWENAEGNGEKLYELLMNEGDVAEDLFSISADHLPFWIPRILLKYLTGLEISEKEAKKIYFQIYQRQTDLSVKLNRKVDLRTAAMDYFTESGQNVIVPRIIDAVQFEKLNNLITQDPNTGCYNHRFLMDFLQKEVSRAGRYSHKLSIIMIDIDDFKKINDTQGHLFGDQILLKFSRAITLAARNEDIVARYGGDEFVVVLPQTGSIGARCLAERIKYKLEKSKGIPNETLQNPTINFSAGIATFPEDASTGIGLLAAADRALYTSKNSGKNNITGNRDLSKYFYKENFVERRRFSRYEVKDGGKHIIAYQGHIFPNRASLLDISRGGILLECEFSELNTIFHENTPIMVKNEKFRLEYDGLIAHASVQTRKNKHCIGMKFKDDLEMEKWTNLEFLYSLGEKK